MIISKTPVRIAFGGGGTDVEPYASDYGGYVLNATINIYFRCVLSKRNDPQIQVYSNDTFFPHKFNIIEISSEHFHPTNLFEAIFYLIEPDVGMDVYVHGEPPKKAGLGASASLSTCLISGILEIENKKIILNEIAEKAYNVEQNVLNNVGGRQDQYAAVYGGLNELKFSGDSKVKVKKLPISKSFKKFIEENIILYYTGEPHTSGDMVKKQVNSYLENKEGSTKSLNKLKQIAYQMRDAFKSDDFEMLGNLLSQDLEFKSEFNPLLLTEHMKGLNHLIIKNGGIGGRVCGAGGGGCMIWLIDPPYKEKIKSLLKNKQGQLIDFKFVDKGLETVEL
jgi:D-glycero-alpha-D-manno-heptose-7-phosphate kinase